MKIDESVMQRWMQQVAKNYRNSSNSSSGNQSARGAITSESNQASIRSEVSAQANVNDDSLVEGISTGIEKLSASGGILTRVKSLLIQAKQLAEAANVEGADRASLQEQANSLLRDANNAVSAARAGGNEALDPNRSGLRMRTTRQGRNFLEVNIAKQRTVSGRVTSPNSSMQSEQTRIFGTNLEDGGKAIPIGSDGSMIMVGKTLGALPGYTNNGSWNSYVARYDPAGSLIWARQYDDRSIHDGALAADGSIFVVGSTKTAIDGQTYVGGDVDSFISKINPDGTTAWTRIVGGTGGDFARTLAVGGDGSVYMAGLSGGNLSTHFDGHTNSGGAYVAKMSSSGTKLWSRRVGDTMRDEGTGVAVAGDGSVYLAGEAWRDREIGGVTQNVKDGYVSKFAADGTSVWSQYLETAGGQGTSAGPIAVGADGAVYVSGSTWGNLEGQTISGTVGSNTDGFLTKISASGVKQWTSLTGNSGAEGIAGVAIGGDGLIYASGTTTGNLDGQTAIGGEDVFLLRYTADGTKLATKLFGVANSGSNDAARPWGIATASDGSIIMSGSTHASIGGQTPLGAKDAFYTRIPVSVSSNSVKTIGLQYEPIDLSSSQLASSAVDSLTTLIGDVTQRQRRNSSALKRAQISKTYLVRTK